MEELQIIPVTTKKERKEFVEYPLRLYKGNPYFVPPFYSDEMKIFTSKNIYNDTCLSSFFLAKRGKGAHEILARCQGGVRHPRFTAIGAVFVGYAPEHCPGLIAKIVAVAQRLGHIGLAVDSTS